MLHLPCYILSGLLALTLVIRDLQHQRTVKSLLDRILQNHGMAALPENHPVADLLGKISEVKEEAKEPSKKKMVERISFKIPGMPVFKGK